MIVPFRESPLVVWHFLSKKPSLKTVNSNQNYLVKSVIYWLVTVTPLAITNKT